MSKALSIPAAIIVAGIAFIVLYPILGVTLWVSFLVAGVLLVVTGWGGARTAAH